METTHTTPVAGYRLDTGEMYWALARAAPERVGRHPVMLPWSNADGIGAFLFCGLARAARCRTGVNIHHHPARHGASRARHVYTLISVCAYSRTPDRRAFVHGSDPLEHPPRS